MADIAQAMLYRIDVKNGLLKQAMTGELMRGDKNANRIIVQLVDGDNSVPLDGVTVTGKFFRGGDGIEIPLEGEAIGNEATVLLDEHCYAVDGYFEASVKLTTGTQTRTILTITGNVVSDGEGGILDIENVVPSVADIVAQYQRMQEVTDQTNAAMQKANEASERANTAAGKANTAENNANNAANNANTQAEAAKSAAAAANAAAKSWGDSTAANSEKLGGKAPEYYLPLRNLLDNSYWERISEIVNQRGQTSYSGQVYGIDRWYGRSYAQKTEVRYNDITVTATEMSYAGIKQKVCNIAGLAGETVTLAAYVYSTLPVAVGFVDADDNAVYETVDNGSGTRLILCTCTVPSDATHDSFVPRILLRANAQNDYMRCYWASLYEGSYTADTLPPYVPKGYAAELAECQRYYFKHTTDVVNTGFGCSLNSGTDAAISVVTPVPMRILPTVTATTLGYVRGNNNSVAVTALNVSGMSGNIVQLNASVDSITSGISVSLINCAYELSADL